MKCPYCKADLEIYEKIHKIPYFGEILIFTVRCPKCGFRKTDIEILKEEGKTKYILEVKEEEDLNSLVIRSTTGRIEIPELGVEIEPGPAAEAFITTVEGILDRIERIVKVAMRWRLEEGNLEAYEKAKEILNKINLAKEGKFSFTLIIEDERGNSAIVSKKAKKIKI